MIKLPNTKLNIGDEVFLPDFKKANYIKTSIMGKNFVESEEDMYHTGYLIKDRPFLISPWHVFSDNELYTNESLVKLDITWINVDLSNEIYEACIGDREKETHFESELGACCSNLSYVRDLILFIKENKGCCVKYIKDIAYIFTTSHPEFLSNTPTNLKKLFKALDIYKYIPTLE